MSVEIKNLTKKFQDTIALNNINITVAQGEFLSILGPSGCGKTTLLRSIAGFVSPDSGSIIANDIVFFKDKVTLPTQQRNLGMVFQSFALWPHMTVRENIEFPLKSRRNNHMSKEEIEQAVDYAMESTGLLAMAKRLPGELSGGQRQRVALARAIVERPKLLLMDEPLSALDAELKINMRKEIKDIHTLTGATIIYVTHDQSEALAMSDRIMIMKSGKIEQIGTPKEIYHQPKTIFASTFVSKCNLVNGKWHEGRFFIGNQPATDFMEDVKECFIAENVLPVRPEQFEISRNSGIIEGKVVGCQFCGRENHYKISCNDQIFTVYASIFESFSVGEKVYLNICLKENYSEIAV